MQEHVGLGHNGPGRHPLARAQLRSPHVALHAAAALVAPFWHEEVYARKASMQGAAALRSIIRANATTTNAKKRKTRGNGKWRVPEPLCVWGCLWCSSSTYRGGHLSKASCTLYGC